MSANQAEVRALVENAAQVKSGQRVLIWFDEEAGLMDWAEKV